MYECFDVRSVYGPVFCLCLCGFGSSAATTSIFRFLNNPKKPPSLISRDCKMTASEPKFERIFFIASGIVAATNFFTFMRHSPPQCFLLERLVLVHCMIKRQRSAKSVLTIVLNAFV